MRGLKRVRARSLSSRALRGEERGFHARWRAVAADSNYTWLVIIGILNSVVGVYYYLNAMKYVYLYRMPNEDEENHPILLTRPYVIALVVLTLGVILVGTVFAPWFSWSDAAALNLF